MGDGASRLHDYIGTYVSSIYTMRGLPPMQDIANFTAGVEQAPQS